MNRLAWSYSRLNDFETCPRMFQGKYVTKDFPKQDFSAPHLQRGKDIHKVLENAVVHSMALPKELLFLQPIVDMAHAKGMTNFAENEICFDVHLNTIDWFSKSAWCRVIIDLVIIVGDLAVIIDWKTGKVRDKSRDQLALFAGAAMTRWPKVKRVITAFFWVDHPKQKPTLAHYDQSHRQQIWEEFGDRAEMIQITLESGAWLPKKNFGCKWCPALVGQCEFKEA